MREEQGVSGNATSEVLRPLLVEQQFCADDSGPS